MISVAVRSPESCSTTELDAFFALVQAGAEVAANGLRSRIAQAERLAFLRTSDDLAGVAGLKRPMASYRRRVERSANVLLPESDCPFELGWVFISPNFRQMRLSFPLCKAAVDAAGSAGLYATSTCTNVGMHATLGKLGFTRAGSDWPSRQSEDALLLFVKRGLTPRSS